jgi:hypothetical protein
VDFSQYPKNGSLLWEHTTWKWTFGVARIWVKAFINDNISSINLSVFVQNYHFGYGNAVEAWR